MRSTRLRTRDKRRRVAEKAIETGSNSIEDDFIAREDDPSSRKRTSSSVEEPAKRLSLASPNDEAIAHNDDAPASIPSPQQLPVASSRNDNTNSSNGNSNSGEDDDDVLIDAIEDDQNSNNKTLTKSNSRSSNQDNNDDNTDAESSNIETITKEVAETVSEKDAGTISGTDVGAFNTMSAHEHAIACAEALHVVYQRETERLATLLRDECNAVLNEAFNAEVRNLTTFDAAMALHRESDDTIPSTEQLALRVTELLRNATQPVTALRAEYVTAMRSVVPRNITQRINMQPASPPESPPPTNTPHKRMLHHTNDHSDYDSDHQNDENDNVQHEHSHIKLNDDRITPARTRRRISHFEDEDLDEGIPILRASTVANAAALEGAAAALNAVVRVVRETCDRVASHVPLNAANDENNDDNGENMDPTTQRSGTNRKTSRRVWWDSEAGTLNATTEAQLVRGELSVRPDSIPMLLAQHRALIASELRTTLEDALHSLATAP